MTRAALRALLEQVEAGTATGGPDALAVPLEQSRLIAAAFGDDDEIWSSVVAAHEGSLDAAKALHEAVLPTYIVDELSQNSRSMGWHILIVSEQGRYVYSHTKQTPFMESPARAWLIAIIRALIEETGE